MLNIQKIATSTGHRAAIYAVVPWLSGTYLTAGGDGWIVEWAEDDPNNGKLLAATETQLFSICPLPAQNRIVAGNINGGVHWIDLSTPNNTKNILHHGNKGVYGLIHLKNWVLSIGGDGVLTKWDDLTSKPIESIALSNTALRAIDYSLIREEIVIGASNGNIYILDVHDFRIKNTLQEAHSNSVFTVKYSPDCQYIVTGGRDALLQVWEAKQNNSLISSQVAHLSTINHVEYSPSGMFFATASRDRSIKIWDARTYKLLKVINTIKFGCHINSVNRLLWLDERLVSVSDDRTSILWKLNLP
jgi:WD40 repeat protein